jgi:hypothetical protein
LDVRGDVPGCSAAAFTAQIAPLVASQGHQHPAILHTRANDSAMSGASALM